MDTDLIYSLSTCLVNVDNYLAGRQEINYWSTHCVLSQRIIHIPHWLSITRIIMSIILFQFPLTITLIHFFLTISIPLANHGYENITHPYDYNLSILCSCETREEGTKHQLVGWRWNQQWNFIDSRTTWNVYARKGLGNIHFLPAPPASPQLLSTWYTDVYLCSTAASSPPVVAAFISLSLCVFISLTRVPASLSIRLGPIFYSHNWDFICWASLVTLKNIFSLAKINYSKLSQLLWRTGNKRTYNYQSSRLQVRFKQNLSIDSSIVNSQMTFCLKETKSLVSRRVENGKCHFNRNARQSQVSV